MNVKEEDSDLFEYRVFGNCRKNKSKNKYTKMIKRRKRESTVFVAQAKRRYSEMVHLAIMNGFKNFSAEQRLFYEKEVKKFLNFYINCYSNTFSTHFKNIIDFHIIKTYEDFLKKKGISVLYRLVNKRNQYKRIGYTGESANSRLYQYFIEIKTNNPKIHTNFHLDARAIGLDKFNDVFEFQVLAVDDSIYKIKNLERLFTIFENYANNSIGYDLFKNNYYNKIIGDLRDYISGEFKGELHPSWKEIKTDELEQAVKECDTWKDILKKLPKVKGDITVRSRALAHGFTVKNIGTLRDIRSYFIKPIIEKGVLQSANPNYISNLLIKNGITFFKTVSNHLCNKQKVLNRYCDFIWGDSIKKIGKKNATLSGVRKLVIIMEVLKLAKSPKFNTLLKVETELLLKGVRLTPRHDNYLLGELGKLCKSINFNYKEEQYNILKKEIKPLLIQRNPKLTIRDIVFKFGLEDTKENKNLIESLIYRIFREEFKTRRISTIRKCLK